MKKIMVIGCGGSGKSTLSVVLSQKLNLEYISLDMHYWKPYWTMTPPKEWEPIVDQLSDKPNWVIDGNYGGTMDIRLKKADTIVFMDYPTWKCFYRVIRRLYKNLNKVRPGLPEGCKSRWDWEFLLYVLRYRRTRRQGILTKLKKVENRIQVFIFKNDKQVRQFLDSIAHPTI